MRIPRLLALIVLFIFFILPLLALVVNILCTQAPWLEPILGQAAAASGNFLRRVFLEAVGEIDAFSYASQLIQQSMGYESLSPEAFGGALFMMISNEVMDAFVLGACVFAIKVTYLRFNQKFAASFLYEEWQLTLAGIIIGIVFLKAAGSVFEETMKILVSGGLVIILMVYGIIRMLNLGNRLRPSQRTYRSRRYGHLANLLLGVLGNGLKALCAVLLLTCLYEGPWMVQTHGHPGVLLLYCALCLLVWVLTELILRWLTPVIR